MFVQNTTGWRRSVGDYCKTTIVSYGTVFLQFTILWAPTTEGDLIKISKRWPDIANNSLLNNRCADEKCLSIQVWFTEKGRKSSRT